MTFLTIAFFIILVGALMCNMVRFSHLRENTPNGRYLFTILKAEYVSVITNGAKAGQTLVNPFIAVTLGLREKISKDQPAVDFRGKTVRVRFVVNHSDYFALTLANVQDMLKAVGSNFIIDEELSWEDTVALFPAIAAELNKEALKDVVISGVITMATADDRVYYNISRINNPAEAESLDS